MTDIQDTTPDVAAQKATTLIESLPWLKTFRDQIVVVKYGGNAMVSDELQEAFAQDIAYLRYVGVQPVVVHGGVVHVGDAVHGVESDPGRRERHLAAGEVPQLGERARLDDASGADRGMKRPRRRADQAVAIEQPAARDQPRRPVEQCGKAGKRRRHSVVGGVRR